MTKLSAFAAGSRPYMSPEQFEGLRENIAAMVQALSSAAFVNALSSSALVQALQSQAITQ